MRRCRIAILVVAVLGLAWSTGRLDAQGGVGVGSRGGIGRAGGIGSTPGGLGGSTPRMGSGPSSSRGSGGMPSSVGGIGSGTLHPHGYLGTAPSSTDAPFATLPAQAAPGTPRSLTPRAPAQPPASIGRRSVTPTVITVPRAQSIPRMGNSIPPLERIDRVPAARIHSDRVHGFRGVDFGYHRAPGFPYRFPVVYLPYGYGYGNYVSRTEQIVIVDHNTATHSNADVTRVPPAPVEPAEPVEPKVLELRPRDADEPAAADPRDPASVEVLRGEQSSGGMVETPLYLLARTDETIVTSREQWLSGNTVHYITPGGEHREILIENLDLDLTARLNQERGLSFRLEVVPQN